MLTLTKTHVTLGDRHWNFDISLQPDGLYAVLGRSGSGKSTLLNLVSGFLTPDSGDVLWNQQSLLTLEPAQRPATTLFQQNNLFSHLSVFQNVGLGIDPGLRLSDEQISDINTVLRQVGLNNYQDKSPANLSGGEQQRVALARCLLRQKPILLLDEPFSALDATTRAEMITLLSEVIDSYKPCVLMVTHDEEDAKAMEAQILRMSDGTVKFDTI